MLAIALLPCSYAQTVSSTPAQTTRLRSHLSIYDLRDHSVHVLYTADQVIEAPNWSPDGKYLLANSGGALYRYTLQPDGSATPTKIQLDPSYTCNNDKTLSPDGKLLAFSAQTPSVMGSQVFVAASDGSHPRLLVPESPSYFHGWSPDGQTLAFVARRETDFDIYRIPVTGGPQQRMTQNSGHNDGPDYSPDGRWIYINSDRSGTEQIWRLPADASGPSIPAQRVLTDTLQDWFPHPSPDGKSLVYMAFPATVEGHNARIPGVQLRLMPLNAVPATHSELLTTFFGGQGTINVNSWSPDSSRIAYVTYEPMP